MMNRQIVIGGKNIFYRVNGQGKPVILVHGFGEDGSIWDGLVEYLRNDFFLIVPDLPGSGNSELISDMSMEGLAELLKEIIKLEGGGPKTPNSSNSGVTMIGHSMGGYITLAFAEKYESWLNGFGLFHSTAYADNPEKIATRQKAIDFIKEHGAFEFLKTSTPNLFSAKTKDERPDLIDKQIASLSNFSAPALVLYYRSMMQRPDRTVVLEKATVPVLLIMGEDDNAVPLKDMLAQSRLPEIAYIHILHESGHMGMLEEAAKSNEAVKEFCLNLNPNSDRPG